MFVSAGARRTLLQWEQARFLNEELPAFAARVALLGLDIEEIVSRLLACGEDEIHDCSSD